MKKLTVTMALAFAASMAANASAQVVDGSGNLRLRGSDTLENIMRQLIIQCPGAGYDGTGADNDGTLSLIYDGGGSGEGESAMERDSCERANVLNADYRHQIGAMSRALDGAACTEPATDPVVAPPATQPVGFVCPEVDPRQIAVGEDDILNLGGSCDEATPCPSGLECQNNLCVDPDNIECTTNADCDDIYAKKSESWECVAGTCQFPGCDLYSLTSAGDGTPDDWGASLRLLYFGIDDATYAPATVTPPQSAAVAANCNSQARRDLVENCGLYHIYRRDDASGTTGDFKRLVGVPTLQPFCNNDNPYTNDAASLNDKEDQDPIRIPCDNEEDVCSCNGTLGLILPILVPPVSGVSSATLYPEKSCSLTGFNFSMLDSAGNAPVNPPWMTIVSGSVTNRYCSDGHRRLVDGCVYGLSSDGDSQCMYYNKDRGEPTLAQLLSAASLVHPSCPAGDASDVRAFNLDVRVAGPSASSRVLDGTGTNVDWVGRAFYRIHSWSQFTQANAGYNFASNTSVMIPNPANLGGTLDHAGSQRECQALDATVQIGCLVGRDARWGKRSMGFAGLEAALVNATQNPVPGNLLKVDNIEPPPEGVNNGYPFSRKLYINTLRNPAAVVDNLYGNGDEKDLLNCVMNEDALLYNIVNGLNFKGLPGGAVEVDYCSDYDICDGDGICEAGESAQFCKLDCANP